jgi:hypothetical protein
MSAEAAAGKAPPSRIERGLLFGAVALALAAGIPLLVSLLGGSGQAQDVHRFPFVSSAGLIERSGVRVIRVAVSGDGGLVDLRYQVVDSEKANAVHDPATPPVVIDEGSGALISRPFMGHIHSGRPKVGLTYYVIFENTGTIIRRGSRVTVRLGNARLAHVPVQ